MDPNRTGAEMLGWLRSLIEGSFSLRSKDSSLSHSIIEYDGINWDVLDEGIVGSGKDRAFM